MIALRRAATSRQRQPLPQLRAAGAGAVPRSPSGCARTRSRARSRARRPRRGRWCSSGRAAAGQVHVGRYRRPQLHAACLVGGRGAAQAGEALRGPRPRQRAVELLRGVRRAGAGVPRPCPQLREVSRSPLHQRPRRPGQEVLRWRGGDHVRGHALSGRGAPAQRPGCVRSYGPRGPPEEHARYLGAISTPL